MCDAGTLSHAKLILATVCCYKKKTFLVAPRVQDGSLVHTFATSLLQKRLAAEQRALEEKKRKEEEEKRRLQEERKKHLSEQKWQEEEERLRREEEEEYRRLQDEEIRKQQEVRNLYQLPKQKRYAEKDYSETPVQNKGGK